MGLGKTVTCVSLIGATLDSSMAFASSPLDSVPPPPPRTDVLNADHFAGSVWGMPDTSQGSSSSKSAKAKAKEERLQEKLEAAYARHCRIKVKSRATLIICPLSIVANWEEQFREHWKGEVSVIGGSSGAACASAPNGSQTPKECALSDTRPKEIEGSRPLHIYIYHGNSRRPDPAFLANFDAVITTYATLASEFSKQNKSLMPDDEEEDANSEDVSGVLDEANDPAMRPPKPKNGKRKKHPLHNLANTATEITSALQSVHWFRVLLDEAQYVGFFSQYCWYAESNSISFGAS